MAWNDEQPRKEELLGKSNSWMAAPPTEKELSPGGSMISQVLSKSPLDVAGDALKGVGRFGLEHVVAPVGRAMERYSAAPTRAAIGAAQESRNPLSAFASQFGQEPSLAPTSEQLVEKTGIESPVGQAALKTALDVGADASMFLPVGAIAKGVSKGAELVGAGAKSLAAPIAKGATKLASTSTGLSEKAIETFAKRADQVENLIKESGGNVSEAANQVREKTQKQILGYKKDLNTKLGEELKNLPSDNNVDVSGIINRLEEYKNKLNPNFKSAEVNQIQGVIDKIKLQAPENATNLTGLNDIKRFLQDVADPAYNSKTALGFEVAGETSRAARNAGSLARTTLNEAAPQVKDINNKLATLRNLETRLNKNIIKPGAPEGALLAVGEGGGGQNRLTLKALEEATGIPMVQNAEDLAAARAFSNAGLVPVDPTGKAAARQLFSVVLGSGVGGPVGGVIGGLATSPAAVKAAIKTGKISSDVVRKALDIVGPVTDAKIEAGIRAMQAARPISNQTRLKALED